MNISLRERITGMFLGIAIGDALYMPTETFGPKKIAEVFGGCVTTYLDSPPGHPFHDELKAGTWTDDTQLTMVIAEAIIAKSGRLDMWEIARQHVIALGQTVNGWGGTTRKAVENLRDGVHFMASGVEDGKGNGIPMKIAPVGAFFSARGVNTWSDEEVQAIADISCMTHRSLLGVESGLAHVGAVQYCLRTDPADFSTELFVGATQATLDSELRGDIVVQLPSLQERLLTLRNIPLENMDTETLRKLFGKGKGYVYDSLPFAYAFFLKNPLSIESLYDVGNAGGDTDTNASIVGGLLGALHGPKLFPKHLVDGLYRSDYIFDVAKRFCDVLGVE